MPYRSAVRDAGRRGVLLVACTHLPILIKAAKYFAAQTVTEEKSRLSAGRRSARSLTLSFQPFGFLAARVDFRPDRRHRQLVRGIEAIAAFLSRYGVSASDVF